MKLEQQVISLELAKRLKALGVKQESYCAWNVNSPDGDTSYAPTLRVRQYGNTKDEVVMKGGKVTFSDLYYAAFTVAELGEMIGNTQNARFFRTNAGFGMEWAAMTDFHTEYRKTEAEARGLMLAYLIENNLLSV